MWKGRGSAIDALAGWLARGTLLVGIVLAIGCHSAFGQAMGRGDASAALGDWDDAARAYEEAVRLDPDDGEAVAKWRRARRAQAEVRLKHAESLIAQGAPRQALGPLILTAYEDVRRATLADGQRAARDGRTSDAVELFARYLVTSTRRDPVAGESEVVAELVRLSGTSPGAAARLVR